MIRVIFKVFVFVLLYCILISCSEDFIKDRAFLDSLSKDFLADKKQILIIPVEGCPSCRNKSLNFMKQNIENKEIGFILTTRKSRKDIRLMLMSRDIDLWDKKFKTLILDTESKAYKTGILDKFPILYRLENQKIKEKQVLSHNIDEVLTDLEFRSR